MTLFTLATPISVGTMSSPVTVTSFEVTVVSYSSTPALAPSGTGELDITLTDPNTGWQESFSYQDSSVLTFWSTLSTLAAQSAVGDIMAQAVFQKLIADGKLPAGTLTTS